MIFFKAKTCRTPLASLAAAACFAFALLCLTCTDKAFFNENEHVWSAPHAFVADIDLFDVSILDSSRLMKSLKISAGVPANLIGLITNPRPGINLEGLWSTGGTILALDTFDTSFLFKHAFKDTGHFSVVFTIRDRMGNTRSDSVAVTVTPAVSPRKKISVDSLLLPLNGEQGVDPIEPGGILFVWKVSQDDPYDTVTAKLLLAKDSLSLVPILTGIKAQFVHVKDTAIGFGKTYFWRVTVESKSGYADSSKIFKFTTQIGSQGLGPQVREIRNDTTVFVFDTVVFFASATDSGGVISRYAWDFDGNGTYEFLSDKSSLSNFVYKDTGVFKAVFKVIDSNTRTAFDTAIITVVSRAQAQKGPRIIGIRGDTAVFISDTIEFYATALDSDAAIVQYAWDFNGDGNFDSLRTTDAQCSHAYADTGVYHAVVRVTDKNSMSAFDTAVIKVTKMVPLAGPYIWSRRNDTSVVVWDSLDFFALALDSSGTEITEFAWDFDGNGIFDYIAGASASCRHAYMATGNYKATVRVTDKNGKTAFETIKISVGKLNLKMAAVSHDTAVAYGGTVRCAITIDSTIGTLTFEIDTGHTGNFIPMYDTGTSARYSFSTGSATDWDSVKMRVYTEFSETLNTGFSVGVVPRSLTINSIDSTERTITVNWSKTLENDFQEYRIYRSATDSVDLNCELVAVVHEADTRLYTTSPSYTLPPANYRIYQRDSEGLISGGSNIVFGHIQNAPPQAPVFITPSKDNDSIWSNSVIRWNKCADPNTDSVAYEVLMNRNSLGFVSLRQGIADTSFQLSGLDSITFRADFKILARDAHGAKDSAVVSGILCKQTRKILQAGATLIAMQVVPKGSFIDSAGLKASISYDYFIDKVEVTQLLYRDVTLDQNGSHINPSTSQNDAQPVETVNWRMTILYCNSMSKKFGLDTAYTFSDIRWQPGNPAVPNPIELTNLQCNFNIKAIRLPTEDEWEMAAQGGRNYLYATDDGTLACTKANYQQCNIRHPATAGSYPANPFGIQDLTGNVWEWCWDEFVLPNNWGRDNNRVDFVAPSGRGSGRILRGGDFDENNLSQLATNSRNYKSPSNGTSRLGFRCVIPMKQW